MQLKVSLNIIQIAEAQIQAEELRSSTAQTNGIGKPSIASSSHSVPLAIRRHELESQNVDQFEDEKLAEVIQKYEEEVKKLKQEKLYAKGEVDNLRRRLELEDEKNQ